jgi:hypothetical protein
MGFPASALSVVAVVVLAGCAAPTRVVERPVVVNVPGPVQIVAVPEGLLGCAAPDEPGRPPALEDGILGGELISRAQAWQAYAACLEGKLGRVRGLSAAAVPGLGPGGGGS